MAQRSLFLYDKAIIATGSVIATIPSFASIAKRFVEPHFGARLTSHSQITTCSGRWLHRSRIRIGLFSLGTQVSVVEFVEGPACREQTRPCIAFVETHFSIIRQNMALQSKVVEIKEVADECCAHRKDKQTEASFSTNVLMSIGRKPHTAGLGLENTKVQVNERGWIIADNTLKPTMTNIYAIGDIVGRNLCWHTRLARRARSQMPFGQK